MLKEVITFTIYEVCTLQGYYALYSGNSLQTAGANLIESQWSCMRPLAVLFMYPSMLRSPSIYA